MSKNNKVRYQTTKVIIWWVVLALVALGILGLLIWLIIKYDSNSDAVNAYFPDALGGLLGVMLGFIIEFTFIGWLNNSRKRRKLIKLLAVEFTGAKEDMETLTEAFSSTNKKEIYEYLENEEKRSIEISKNEREEWQIKIWKIQVEESCLISVNYTLLHSRLYKMVYPILEDVMDNADNLVLLKFKELELIRKINIAYINFNSVFIEKLKMQENGKVPNDKTRERWIKAIFKNIYIINKNMAEFMKWDE